MNFTFITKLLLVLIQFQFSGKNKLTQLQFSKALNWFLRLTFILSSAETIVCIFNLIIHVGANIGCNNTRNCLCSTLSFTLAHPCKKISLENIFAGICCMYTTYYGGVRLGTSILLLQYFNFSIYVSSCSQNARRLNALNTQPFIKNDLNYIFRIDRIYF